MHLAPKQRVYTFAAGFAMLVGVSYVGMRQARPDAPLSVEPISATTPPVGGPGDVETPKPVTPEPNTPKEVIVAVAGAVKAPGLLHLPLDARVDDAIKRAGGAKPDADLEAINLAAKAVDGDQIYVPTKKAAEVQKVALRYRGGEVSPHDLPLAPSMPPTLSGSVGGPGEATSKPAYGGSRGGAKRSPAGPVSLSTASLEQLQTLPGVGPSTAQKIVDYRMEHGGFSSIDEIQAVKGIGPKKFEKMRPFLKP